MTARFERVIQALDSHGCAPRGSGGQYSAKCPAHDDRSPSLSATEKSATPGQTFLFCQAGCSVNDIVAALNLTLADLFPDREESAAPTPRRSAPGQRRVEVAAYDYTDNAGTVLFQKVRFEPKTFAVRRPDGKGGWTSGIGEGQRVLYRLPELTAAIAAGSPVWVVEGEKDADRLAALGIAATCNFDGAGRDKWKPAYGDALLGAHVVVVADNDAAGMAHATAVVADMKAKAASIRVVRGAVEMEHADLSDHLDAGFTLDDLVELPDIAPDQGARLGAVPEYPVWALPQPLRSLVEDGTLSGLPAAYVGAGGLAALAYAALDARVQVSDRWVEPPALWLPLLGAAGTAKSPGWRYAYHEVWAHESRLRADFDVAMDNYRAEQSSRKGSKDGTPPPEKPVNPCRVMTDVTPEMLVRRLADGPRCLVVDELRSWLGSLGRYGANGPVGAEKERGFYLSCWDASAPAVYDRVTGDVSLVAEDPVVPVVGTLQVDDAVMLGDVRSGFRARWLPHIGPAYLDATEDTGDSVAPTQFEERMRDLLTEQVKDKLLLRGQARMAWTAAKTRWKAEGRHAPPGVASALAKADRQALRVALALAVGKKDKGLVSLEAMTGAIAIVDYAMACWRALPEGQSLTLSRREERLTDAVATLASWLETRQGGRATRREIARAAVAGARTSEVVDALLGQYAAMYPGSVRVERVGQRGPTGVVVHAPVRTKVSHPTSPTTQEGIRGETVSADSFTLNTPPTPARTEPEVRTGDISAERAGNAADSFSADSLSADSYQSPSVTEADDDPLNDMLAARRLRRERPEREGA